ncbi:MAG TPA: ATP-binding protein, partial [Coriobacteriia bacterium]|nr:ATP-binding protein [Coriobacteriia bacterium]
LVDDGLERCEDVLASLKAVIDEEMERLGKGRTTTPAEEDAAHEAFRRERGASFTGREEYLTAIAKYLGAPASHPLVVWGYGGSGKSALLAKAIEDARGPDPANDQPPSATLVHRFIGATPKSADIRSLLQDLFGAIGDRYGLEGEMPSDFNELVRAFRERLEAAGAKRPLLLFLDSLDQLSTTYGAQGFTWLPTDLPEGVWVVASIRADEDDEARLAAAAEAASPSPMSGPLGTLQRTLPESALLELGPMSRHDAEKLLAKWLALAGRTLQPEQWDAVLDSFARYDPIEHRGMPLHLRLAFGRAQTWCSYDKPEGIRDKVRDMVAALYEHLEREHGPLLVGHTLAYLAATRNTMGLAEDEILDLLPTDKEVFDEFKRRSKHTVAEGRIPVIVWSRLYFDLAPYLGTRSSEGATLLAFYHRELGEVATKRYLEGNRKERHGQLAAMFETMADSKGDHSWTGRPRALAELPYHLAGAKDWDAVF